MATVTYNGQAGQDFESTAFWDYMKMREGYRLAVYPDSKGNPTVGIGHLLPAGTALGTIYTEAQVLQLFESDYDSLNIEKYVTESSYTLNQMLCIGSFIWNHGAGDYNNSEYQQHWLSGDYPNEADMQAYLLANWDIHSPDIQARTAKDCAVAYSTTDWSPNF